MKFLVTVGCHTGRGRETFDFWQAGLLLIDWETKEVERWLTYQSPPEHYPQPGRMLFHSGSLIQSTLVTTTCSEVVCIDVDKWEVQRVISSRHFNDLHHAIVNNGDLFVCNTGLQAVHRLGADGEVIDTWSVGEHPTWEVYDADLDYRALSTKPHPIHPNHLFAADGQLWVTRCQPKDAVVVGQPTKRLGIGVGFPHDGLVHDELIYFTTVNGYIVGICPRTGQQKRVIDLNTNPGRGQLGWCRGICMLSTNLALVGFSQFRPSKHKDLVHWILRDGKARLPSRLALVDLAEPRVLSEMPFTGPLEGAAIYSIFSLP